MKHSALKKLLRTTVVLTAAILSFSAALPAMGASYKPFYRLDSSHPSSGLEKLSRVRFLTDGGYKLKNLSEKEMTDPSFRPSLKGLDDLRISGSPQYNELQFREIAGKIREYANGDPVYIIDLRQESHFFVNGAPVSVYGPDNTANRGKGLAEVEADENARLEDIRKNGLTVYSYGSSGSKKKHETVMKAYSCMTERELAESEGFGYLRLPATDHEWPAPELVDEFIDFLKQVDMDHVWLHFHCLAGHGRTGVYMAIYDMMKNPDVTVEDVSARQAMAGSTYILKKYGAGADERKLERARMLRLMYTYLQENRADGYRTKWSEWMAANGGADQNAEARKAA